MEPFAKWVLSRDLHITKESPANGKANGAIHTNGLTAQTTKKKLGQLHRSVLRFAEQGWSFIYYTVQWSYGFYLYRHLPTQLFNLKELWRDSPHAPVAGPVKFYYLVQFAFYLHQVLILNAEARRKDHVQMMAHHVITIVLMFASYFGHFTRIGCVILLIMDWSDILLPMAKMFRYLAFSTVCDTVFGLFLLSWLITRHALFIVVIVSAFVDIPAVVTFEWAPERGRYLSRTTWILLSTMLVALQVLQVAWFWMICRVAWRVFTKGEGASDDRSDDEGIDQEDKKDQ
jgi:acyl-CoA-dependent ceramide synthase